MPAKSASPALKATFPISDTELVVLLEKPIKSASVSVRRFSSISRLRIRAVDFDESRPKRVVLKTASMRSDQLVVDRIEVKGLVFADGRAVSGRGPAFVHGVKDPSELKGPQVETAFPYPSKLVGVHVTVACCTGCNGGVHDRNLVVLNHHVGGPGTGVWVETGKTIDAPYPRWQKVMCAGGVVKERGGSTTVVDEGWMEIMKQFEQPHHAPPPLPIETVDLPNSQSKTLLSKSLDASWVQFDDIRVESAQTIEPAARRGGTVRLVRNEITFTDRSGGKTTAYLYQPTGHKVQQGQSVRRLRGFVHAEKSGYYVLLSDKEEDIQV